MSIIWCRRCLQPDGDMGKVVERLSIKLCLWYVNVGRIKPRGAFDEVHQIVVAPSRRDPKRGQGQRRTTWTHLK